MSMMMQVLFIALLSLSLVQCRPMATGKLLSNQVAMYPRAIELAYQSNTSHNGIILADVTQFSPAGHGGIYESTDNGANFTQVGSVNDPLAASTGLCCSTLYELPIQIGKLAPGTLLWAASINNGSGANRRMKINIWQSTDIGRTWTFLSTPASAANQLGLWEPEFSIDATNRLIMHFSDETLQPKYSQCLQEVYSTDGINWSQRYPTVALTNPADRPGMANVRQINNTYWVMSYEVCGQSGIYACAAYLRGSSDGFNWGDPTQISQLVQDSSQRYFLHCPTLAYNRGTHELIMGGQILTDSNGNQDPASGATLFKSDMQTSPQYWTSFRSPVNVPDTKNDVCPNYSSALLLIRDGSMLLEIATDYSGSQCMAYFNVESVTSSM